MSIVDRLPKGARMTPESARSRHRINTWLLLLHIPVLTAVGTFGPRPASETLLVLLPATFAAMSAIAVSKAGGGLAPHAYDLTSLGLLSCSFVLIELTGGLQEAHFHLYVILVFVALYQSWRALLWAVASVAVHHAVLGAFFPLRVFGMPVHGLSLLWMVAYHAGMVVLEVIGILCLWHFAEATEADYQRLTDLSAEERSEAAEERQTEVERVDTERRRRTAVSKVTAALVGDAERIRASAADSSRSVENVDAQLGMLSAAVQAIAERAHRAATTATTGRQSAEKATGTVERLEHSMTEISTVNAVIGKLAAQTNLLSLNATIEAARAGEMGRGFAVVAHEVKQLAIETATSAEKVNKVIVLVIQEAAEVAASFALTRTVVTEIQGIQSDIATSVEEQAASVRQVWVELSNAAAATKTILRSLDDLTATAVSLT